MPNPGNRGKRYTFRHITRADVSERGGVEFELDCGHILGPYEPQRPGDYVWTQAAAQAKVGERQACHQCGLK